MSDVAGWVYETKTGEISGTLKDQDGAVFTPDTITFSLYDLETKSVINSRSSVSLTPVATYHNATTGKVTFNLTAADNAFVTAGNREEVHIARFEFSWLTGARTSMHEIPFVVRQKPDIV